MQKNFTIIFFSIVMAVMIFFAIVFDIKTSFLWLSIISLLMYLHITATTLCNILTTNGTSKNTEVVWQLFFIFSASISFSVFYNM